MTGVSFKDGRASLAFVLVIALALVAGGAQAKHRAKAKASDGEVVREIVVTANRYWDPKVKAHIDAYIAAVNASGEAETQAFRDHDIAPSFAAEIPSGPFRRYFITQHRVTGGIDFIGMEMKGADDVHVTVRDKVYGAPHGLHFTLEHDGARRITTFEPEAASYPRSDISLPPSAIGNAALVDLRRGCKAGVFSGAMLVAKGDTVVARAACGQANRRYHAANTVNTRFNLGSANKMFTALSVMQLVEQGRVSLDDRMSKYADESWMPRSISEQITVGQLLAHTSGLGDFLDAPAFRDSSRAHFRELSDYKPLLKGATLAFPPGTKFQYSDTGMLMLGVVIEHASGQSYFDYVRQHIYAPAGMAHSDSYPMDEPVENLAMGYTYAPEVLGQWRENTFSHVFRGGPAGGGFSTVDDMYRFARALRAGKLVSRATLEKMWTPGLSSEYGLGFEIESSPAGRIAGHSGIFQGVSDRFRIYRDKDYVVVVLSNVDGGGYALGDAVGDLISDAL